MISTTRRRGRRPGNPDTRAQIIEAARAVFASEGYEATSSRSIARAAGVDPALIHHYFESKAQLYLAALDFPRDPREVRESLDPDIPVGEQLVLAFLRMWEGEGPPTRDQAYVRHPFVTAVQAAVATPNAGVALREFLEERVWSQRPRRAGDSDEVHNLRRALVASQLFGLGWVRHVLRLEPIASAPLEDIARAAGPTIERYVSADFSASSES